MKQTDEEVIMKPSNIDTEVVEAFGKEWQNFNQSELSEKDQLEMFNLYFDIFPWHKLSQSSVGFDLGCGSGRWAELVAPKVGLLHCIEPSSLALKVAEDKLKKYPNCQLHQASVDSIPLDDNSVDFGYAIGVLHHVPEPELGLKCCVTKLKKNAPFLVNFYYAFDNRPWWFKLIWKISELGRTIISSLPFGAKYLLSQLIALTIYLPLARCSFILEKLGIDVDVIPLSYYRYRNFYVMRTDALDRFGTKLEKRFSKNEISKMMENSRLENITFSDHAPYWCAVGYKK